MSQWEAAGWGALIGLALCAVAVYLGFKIADHYWPPDDDE